MQQPRVVADGGGGIYGEGQMGGGTSIMVGEGRDFNNGGWGGGGFNNGKVGGGFQHLEYKLKYNNTYI